MRLSGCWMNVFAGAAMGLLAAALAWGQSAGPKAAGEAVYKQRCAGCHEQANSRIPPRTALNQMPATRIKRALDFGAMMTVAYPLSRDEREAVAAYLGTSAPAIAYPPGAYCADRRATVSDRPKSSWNGWSPGSTNSRYQSAEAAGLSIDQVRGLKLKWAFGFDGDVTAFSQPTVIDGQVFVGVDVVQRQGAGVAHRLRVPQSNRTDEKKTGGETGAIDRTRNAQPRSGLLLGPDSHCDLVPTGREVSKRYVATACRPR